MTRSLCVPLLCALFSLPTHAGSVEFAQWIPWSFLSQEMKKKELFVQETEPSVRLNLGELKPELKNVELEVAGALDQLEFTNQSVSLSAEAGLTLILGEIKVDQMIVREFGGNVLQVQIKANCGRATISLPHIFLDSLFAMKAENKYLPSLHDLNIQIPDGSWSVSPIRCSGLSGIGAEIETTLNQSLKNPAVFTSLIKDWVSPLLDEWIRNQWLSVNSSEGQWAGLTIDPPNDKGFLVRGNISLTGNDEVFLPENFGENIQSPTPRFYLSRAGFQTLIQDRLRSLLPKMYDLRENDSFRKLLKSRIMQYLVWPDLRRFNSSTPFVLKNDPNSLLLSLAQDQAGWKADLSGRGSLMTVIGGSPIDYIVYSMSLNLPVKMELKSGDLYFSTGKATAKLAWSFSYFYQLIYKPDNRIPLSLLTNALSGIASDRKEKVALPQFSTGNRDYMLSNLRTEDQLVTMDWL
ncbi:MAG: hypothetical protein V4598_04615 [Bdellovibrionota bacterium]